jgi:hypothetical protein
MDKIDTIFKAKWQKVVGWFMNLFYNFRQI